VAPAADTTREKRLRAGMKRVHLKYGRMLKRLADK
jgi:hypothetical protein